MFRRLIITLVFAVASGFAQYGPQPAQVQPNFTTAIAPAAGTPGASLTYWAPTPNSPNLAAWYDISDVSTLRNNAGNVPSPGDSIKLIADKSGNSATNVLCLNGVAGQYGSSADSPAVSVTGDIDLMARIAPNQYNIASTQRLISKRSDATHVSYDFFLTATTQNLTLITSADGSTLRTATSSATLGISNFVGSWVRVTRSSATGDVTFYYAADQATTPTSWTQLGTVQSTTAGGIFDGTQAVEIGSTQGGTAGNFAGLFYRAKIYNGFSDSGGTLAFDANFATASKLATSFTESSSNAATVTINTSGATGARICGARDLYQGTAANQPVLTISASGNYLTFDGVNDYMKSAAFSLAQPESIYLVGQQVTWVNTRKIFTGSATTTPNRGQLRQTTITPTISIFAGNSAPSNNGWPVATNAIVTTILNGASSGIRVNRTAITTGDSGTEGQNGFTLAADADGTLPANITASEVLIFAAAHDTATQGQVITYLASKWHIAGALAYEQIAPLIPFDEAPPIDRWKREDLLAA